MAKDGRPRCPVEGCDGDLYHEFLTGLNQSTSQMMRIGGLALIAGTILFGAPFFIDNVVRMAAGVGGAVGTVIGLLVPIVAGVLVLRHRAGRMSERREQHRCNKCGTVFPVNAT